MTISTLSFNTSTRTSLVRLQTQLSDAQQELNTGKHADVGRTLGRLTGSAISARAQESSFIEQQTSNKLVTTRVENIEASLTSIRESAESLANNLIGISVATDFDTIIDQAKSGLQTLTGSLNAASGGQYLFGGTNTDVAPIADYDGSPAKNAAATSFSDFLTATGTTAATVKPEDLRLYLTTGYADPLDPAKTHKYADLFTEAAWSQNWSSSTADTIQSRISKTETLASSASANEAAYRDIASAYTMLTDLGLETLGDSARDVVTSVAREQLTTASRDVVNINAAIGTRLQRIDAANTELKRQQDIMEDTVSTLEDVDITETSLKINALKTQLEAAYTVSGRLQNLSLLNYL